MRNSEPSVARSDLKQEIARDNHVRLGNVCKCAERINVSTL